MAFADQPPVEGAEIAGFGNCKNAHYPVLSARNRLSDKLFAAAMATVFQLRSEVSDVFTDAVQRKLAQWNRARLAPRLPDDDWRTALETDREMLLLEGRFLETLRAEVRDRAAAAPTQVDAFVAWFESLQQDGPGQGDALFPWLAQSATLPQMRWYLEQEAAGEAGFDDLTALTQVKLPNRVKLELARNYWDEMGRGNAKAMHGPMLERLTAAVDVKPAIERTAWQSLALANAMTAMATRRDYAWHSLGALGAIELTAPGRSAAVAEGLKRLGLPAKARTYFDLHATLDVKHSQAWNAEAIGPAVAGDPARATAIAEGALMRLRCGERCFDLYRRELW